MAGPKTAVKSAKGVWSRTKAVVRRGRRKSALFDHVVGTIDHYNKVKAGVLAGGITYYGFLSFFPLIALAFASVGIVAHYYKGADENLENAINGVLPGLIGEGDGQIPISAFTDEGATIGIIGAVTFIYTGLGWLSAMRGALEDVYAIPHATTRNYFHNKLVDLVVLLIVGVTLLVSVALTGLVTAFSERFLEWFGFVRGDTVDLLLRAVTIGLGIAASMALFMILYRLLPRTDLPWRSLIKGALVASLGFEVLKIVASYLISRVSDSPAAAVLGVALVLLVWIQYFSRLTLYGAAWATTAPEARESKERRRLRIEAEEAAKLKEQESDAVPGV
jgi:membrane protein